MMRPIQLGIVGCGVVSDSHLQLAAECPLVEMVAVADLRRSCAETAAEKYKISSWYEHDEDLLKDPRVEAVVLAIPAGVRTSIACKALGCGKHVLLEKPAAISAEEIEKMMALRHGRVVACCYCRYAFAGHAQVAAQSVAQGLLGKIRVVRIRALRAASNHPGDPPPWRQSISLNGGGILVNWGCYDLDYMMQVTGWQLKPKEVMAHWWPVAEKMSDFVAAGSDADSHYTAFVQCEDGVVISMERGEFSSSQSDMAWQIIGTDASLCLPMRPTNEKKNAVILDQFRPGEGVVSKTIWTETDVCSEDDVIHNFARAIRDGSQPKTSLERALVVQKITDAIYASAKSGRSVSVS